MGPIMLVIKITALIAALALGACAAIAPTAVATSQAQDAAPKQAATKPNEHIAPEAAILKPFPPDEPPAVITAGPVGYGGRLTQPSRLP
jgi:hypothetical protein